MTAYRNDPHDKLHPAAPAAGWGLLRLVGSHCDHLSTRPRLAAV